MSLLIPINDGYTLEATIPARGRVPAVTFRYRPALPEAVYEYQRLAKLTGKEAIEATVGLLAKQLVSWDVSEGGGSAPVNDVTLRRVPHRVLEKMIDIVTGYSFDEQTADLKN